MRAALQYRHDNENCRYRAQKESKSGKAGSRYVGTQRWGEEQVIQEKDEVRQAGVQEG